MDRINPLYALATLLVNLTIKNVAQLGGALVDTAGQETARTFVSALTTAVNERPLVEDDEDCDLPVAQVVMAGLPGFGKSVEPPAEQHSVMFHFNPQKKIHAIRTLREILGWGLRVAKDWVDNQNPSSENNACGCIVHRVSPAVADSVSEHLRMLAKWHPESDCYGYAERSDWVVFPSNLDVHNVPETEFGFNYGWGVKIHLEDPSKKIQTIKTVRAVMGCGLKQAKYITDEAYNRRYFDEANREAFTIFCDVDEKYESAVARGVTGMKSKTFEGIKISPYYHSNTRPRPDATVSFLANQRDISPQDAGFLPY